MRRALAGTGSARHVEPCKSPSAGQLCKCKTVALDSGDPRAYRARRGSPFVFVTLCRRTACLPIKSECSRHEPKHDALSIFERARIAIELENELSTGLDLARRSILLDPEPSYRHYFIVSEVLKHLEAGRALDIGDLEFALDVATGLGRARRSGFRSKATEAMTVFKQKLEVLSKTAISENDRDDEEEPEVLSDADDDTLDATDETTDSV